MYAQRDNSQYGLFTSSDRNIHFIAELLMRLKKIRGPLMVAQWLRDSATNRKVAGSIPDGVIGIFH
jgi:hypothetical protein